MPISEAHHAFRERAQSAARSRTRMIQDCKGFWKSNDGPGSLTSSAIPRMSLKLALALSVYLFG
jgi:hypothetical protein